MIKNTIQCSHHGTKPVCDTAASAAALKLSASDEPSKDVFCCYADAGS